LGRDVWRVVAGVVVVALVAMAVGHERPPTQRDTHHEPVRAPSGRTPSGRSPRSPRSPWSRRAGRGCGERGVCVGTAPAARAGRRRAMSKSIGLPDAKEPRRDDGHGLDATAPAEVPAKGWKDVALRVKDDLRNDHTSLS